MNAQLRRVVSHQDMLPCYQNWAFCYARERETDHSTLGLVGEAKVPERWPSSGLYGDFNDTSLSYRLAAVRQNLLEGSKNYGTKKITRSFQYK